MNFTKSMLSLAVAAVVFASCKNSEKAPAAAVSAPKTETASVEKPAVTGKVETATFHIEGMTCAVMCAGKIEKELNAMNGVQKAKVDFDKKTATVEYDNAVVTPANLVAKVEAVADGKTYKVSDVKTTADHAMLTGDPAKDKKSDKKDKKADKKSEKKEGKGCCAGKKHCSEMM